MEAIDRYIYGVRYFIDPIPNSFERKSANDVLVVTDLKFLNCKKEDGNKFQIFGIWVPLTAP